MTSNLLATVLIAAPVSVAPPPDSLTLQRSQWTLRHVDYEFALEQSQDGVPRLNFDRFGGRPRRVVERRVAAIVVENDSFRATLLPAMGRLQSFVHKATGREQLWINPVAVPIAAHNDTAFWVTWGGIEHVLPRGEHGTSHALVWDYQVEEDTEQKRIRMRTVEPLTGLVHTVTYSASAASEWLTTTVQIHNAGAVPVAFSHWTTAVLAPGGNGQVTARTELLVPAARWVPADRPFNRWMHPLLGQARTSPLRFMQNWQDIGDLMTTDLTSGFYAAYSHEMDEGVIRRFDRERTPGLNIWTWGYPPSLERQQEYTAQPPNLGYVEFWNGTARDFADDARRSIEPGETIQWVEELRAVHHLADQPDLFEAVQKIADKR